MLPAAVAAQPLASTAPERAPILPAVAVGVSVGATAVAVGTGMFAAGSSGNRAVFVALGLGVAPSLGNLLQGEWGDAATGFGIRAGGVVIVIGAAFGALAGTSDDYAGLAVMGGLVILSGVAYDAVTAGMNAHARRVQLTPTGTGLALTVGL